MGSTNFSDDEYASRAQMRARSGSAVFQHQVNVAKGVAHGVHATLDARNMKVLASGIKGRESRDSDVHPESLAIATILDVTGSMNKVPEIIQKNLPKLMGLLTRKGYVDHPHILTMAIGDGSPPSPDKYPLQVGQFEAGIEIENDLTNLILEGGGGGQRHENYELAMYFLANHTSIDCLEKRGKKGYAFFIGDEMPYETLNRRLAEELIGIKPEADLALATIVEQLKAKYECYFIMPNLTSYYNDHQIVSTWERLFGADRVLRLEAAEAICELIASTIGIAEGKVGLEDVDEDLQDAGTGEKGRAAVGKALAKIGSGKISKRAKGSDLAVKDSGAPSGVATM